MRYDLCSGFIGLPPQAQAPQKIFLQNLPVIK